MRSKLPSLSLVVFAVAFGSCGVWCGVDSHQKKLGINTTEAMLRGDPAAQLESFEIDYQQRLVRCSDPDVLRYLERCFRDKDKLSEPRGLTYRLRLRFVGGERLDATTYWSENGFNLFMPYQATDTGDEPRVKVTFKTPMPQAVKELLTFLTASGQDDRGRGVRLLIDSGGVRREFDRSLLR